MLINVNNFNLITFTIDVILLKIKASKLNCFNRICGACSCDFIYLFIIVCVYLYMHMYNFLCFDSLLYTSFIFFLLYMVFIHVIVHAHVYVTHIAL